MIKRQVPNMITLCNLACGVLSVFAALRMDQPTLAALFICLGIIFDFFDGLTARLLAVSSPIGKELDSLADVVTSGVAPATILYSLTYPILLNFHLEWLAFIYMLIPLFAAYRLAKFNLDTRQSTEFIGLPTPANALFWGALALGQHAFLTSQRFNALFLLLFMILFSWLLVAEVPMLSLKFKTWDWRQNSWKYILLLGTLPCLLLGRSAFAAIILWYIVLSLVKSKTRMA